MKPSGIGGQAVIEGVMMRNGGKYAVAVRTPDQGIVVDVQDCASSSRIKKMKIAKLPIVRGAVNFVDSLILGMKSLMFSASQFAEETQEEKEERESKARAKALAKAQKLRSQGKEAEADKVLRKCEEKLAKEAAQGSAASGKEESDWMMTATVVFSLAFSIILFMMLPYFISRGLKQIISSELLILIAEGIVKLLIFTGYLALVSRMKDIQRTFMYHGAEHKCINCIESGLELKVDNVRISSKEHKRCGTSFLFITMFVSIVFIMVFSIPMFRLLGINSAFSRIVLRLALLPVIAGVSYELIILAGKYDNALVNALSKPGLMMQHLTTKEPDDSMIEVAIASVEAVFDWKKFLNEQFDAGYELEEKAQADD